MEDYRSTTGTLAINGDPSGIATKGGDVLLNPAECLALVQQANIVGSNRGGGVCGRERRR